MGNAPKGSRRSGEDEVLARQAAFASAVADQVGKAVDAKLDAFRVEAILAAAHTHQVVASSITDKIDEAAKGLREDAILASSEANVVMQKAADDVAEMKKMVEQELDMGGMMLNGNADIFALARQGSGTLEKDDALALAIEADSQWAPRATKSHVVSTVLGHAAGVVTGVVLTGTAVVVYNWYTAEDENEFVVEDARPRVVNG